MASVLYQTARDPARWRAFKEIFPKITRHYFGRGSNNREMVAAIRAANYVDDGNLHFHDSMRFLDDIDEGHALLIPNSEMVKHRGLRASDQHHIFPREINRLFGDPSLLHPTPSGQGWYLKNGILINRHVFEPGNLDHKELIHMGGGPYRNVSIEDRRELFRTVSEHFGKQERRLARQGLSPTVFHYHEWGMEARKAFFGTYRPTGGGVW